jgi:repressor LexA
MSESEIIHLPLDRGVAAPRRMAVLAFIAAYATANGFPPSVREITDALNLSSTSVAAYHLAVLADQGRLERTPHVARGLRVISGRAEL